MSEPKTSLRGVRWPAINPADGTKFSVLVSQGRIRWIIKLGVRAIRELEYVVTWVLTNPKHVYEGLMREGDEDRYSDSEDWRCYSAAPSFGFDDEGNRIPIKGEVMLVFVNKDLTAYNWRWEDEDPSSPGTPLDLEGRFKREVL